MQKVRMQPIGSITSRFQRLVRDLSKELGKTVSLHMEGNETELDKTLLEAIRDPLTHIVRNSLDHGIESPEIRSKQNKPIEGKLAIKSFQEGGQVFIAISDDGKGLDPTKIGEKALEKGLVTAEELSRKRPQEIIQYIFAPGFSTASQITNVSGRGVGMDVVKTNAEKIGGKVELFSKVGEGTTITLKVPLTLAVIPALLIRANGQVLALPQGRIDRLLGLGLNSSAQTSLLRAPGLNKSSEFSVKEVAGFAVLCLEKDTLPIIDLTLLLQGKHCKRSLAEFPTDSPILVAVLKTEQQRFAVVVEDVLGSADVTIKRLGSYAKNAQLISGASVMGDGSIALVLDIGGVARVSRIDSENSISRNPSTDLGTKDEKTLADQSELLMVSLNNNEAVCIPLHQVTRLERFNDFDVTKHGNILLTRHGKKLIPLFELSSLVQPNNTTQLIQSKDFINIPTIIVQKENNSIGFFVHSILDIVSKECQKSQFKETDWIIGSCIINGKILQILDLFYFFDRVLYHGNLAAFRPEETKYA